MRMAPAAAAARQLGQGVERRLGAAEVIDQLAEGDRADVLAADQAQAGEPLAASSGACGSGAGVSACQAGSGRLAPILRLLAGEQAADVGVVLAEDRIAMTTTNSRPALGRATT